MPSLSLTNYNMGLLNQQNKNRDLVGEMLAGTNPNAGIKNYSGNKLMPLVSPNVGGQPTPMPMINNTLVPTGVTYPNVKDPNAKGKLGMGVKLSDTITNSEPDVPINPKVVSYLTSKYKSNSKSESQPKTEDKQELPQMPLEQETPDDPENSKLSKILAIVGGGLSSYGSGLLGHGTGAAGQQMMNTINTIRERDKETDLKNPKSRESIHARNLAKQLYGEQYKVDPNLTALQFRESSPLLDNLYARTFKQQESEKDRAFKEKQFNAENSKDWARINMQKEAMGIRSSGGGTSSGRASAGKAGKPFDLDKEQEKRLTLARDIQQSYKELAEVQKKGSPLTDLFDPERSKKIEILKNRILDQESVLRGQGQLEQGIRKEYAGALDPGYTESRETAAKRNEQLGNEYTKKIVNELAQQTGMAVAADDETGEMWLINPETKEKVRRIK